MAGLWVGDFMSGCLFRRRMFHSIFYYIKYIQFVSKSREKHVRVKTQDSREKLQVYIPKPLFINAITPH